MNFNEKMELCAKFFEELSAALQDNYEVVGSCNKDASQYLIPKGTEEEISYYGKPYASFRISDHWNWYSNLKKCTNEWYIQCYSVDIPWALKRNEEGKASKPRHGIQVSFFGPDKKYHCVYGEKFNRKTKTWTWVDNSVENVLASIRI